MSISKACSLALFITASCVPVAAWCSPLLSPEHHLRAAQGLAEISGEYFVAGLNEQGKPYSGRATIWQEGSAYRMRWQLNSGEIYEGRGTRRGDLLTINWGDSHPVVYRITPEGRLNGTWANGTATEDLSPAR